MATLLLLAFTVGFAWTLIREGSQQHGAIRSSRDSTSSMSSFILFTSFHFEMVPRSVHLLSLEITTPLESHGPPRGRILRPLGSLTLTNASRIACILS